MNLRQLALVGIAALAVGGTAVAQVGQPAPSPVTPPPPPPPNGAAATPGSLFNTAVPTAAGTPPSIANPSPVPSASAAPGRKGRKSATPEPQASPSDTPEPPQFQTMDGVWEVQVQPMGSYRTLYSHLYITQKAETLSGTWVHDKVTVPFTGTFDGRLFKLTLNAGKDIWTMSGYAENFGDMVGLLITADPRDRGTPFTAAHRKKEKIS